MPAKKQQQNLIGAWAFLIGVILAVIVGLFGAQLPGAIGTIQVLLVILGIIVGLLNVSTKDINTFLLAAVSLVIVSYAGKSTLDVIGGTALLSWLGSLFGALMLLFIPATVVVALKAVFAVARS